MADGRREEELLPFLQTVQAPEFIYGEQQISDW
jgi:hypothetical protein